MLLKVCTDQIVVAVAKANLLSLFKACAPLGRYNFTEFDQLVKDRGMVSEFSPYEFRIEKE